MLGKWEIVLIVRLMCCFRLNSGFFFLLDVIVMMILLNRCDVCFIRFRWLLVRGLNVFG